VQKRDWSLIISRDVVFNFFHLLFCFFVCCIPNIRIFNFKFSTPLWRVQLTLIWNKNKQNNLFLGFSLDVNLGRYIYNILKRNEAEILHCFLSSCIEILVVVIFRSKRSYYSGIDRTLSKSFEVTIYHLSLCRISIA